MVTKTKIIPVTRDEEVVEDILCNICGESLKDNSGLDNFEGLSSRLCGGYGSLLGDGIEYEFAICETCLKDKIFPTFKIPPKIDHSDWLGGGIVNEDGEPLEEEEDKPV